MMVVRRYGVASVTLLLGLGFGMLGPLAQAQSPTPAEQPPPPPEAQAPPALDAPRTEVEALPSSGPAAVRVRVREQDPSHDARVDVTTTVPPARVYVTKEPPPPIAERASADRPNARAVWTPGYWEWDPDGDRFVWVAGSWRVPPAGKVWVAGRWMHDAGGWYWVPGVWGRHAMRPAVVANQPAWRTTGPPAEQPDDEPPPAPGPDSFYIPGHYAPMKAGDRLAWVPGFWAAVQPGWDWIPARWIRRPDGWDFREGHWMRDPDAAVVVERVPARVLRRARRNANVAVITRDPITGAEVDVQANGAPLPVGAVVGAMPYYVIRQPGEYPYGPGGVVVPGTVPPFVRRILDQVLP